MWNIQTLEHQPERIRTALAARNSPLSLDGADELLQKRRELIRAEQALNRDRKSRARSRGRPPAEEIEAMRALRARALRTKNERAALESTLHDLVATIPNEPHQTVPRGRSSEDNVLVRRWGAPTLFGFGPRDHVSLAGGGGLDLERGARLSGHGFPVLCGDVARLNRALINFMLDTHRTKGYRELAVPFVVRPPAFFGTGQLPKFHDDLYWIGEELGLVPTAEVPLTNLHAGEVLPADSLPLKLTAYTPCFRREAGSYGRDVRGIVRVHQFEKVELVRLTQPQASYEALEELTDDAESILRGLGLPHRRMALCTGDLGFSAAKTYDVEVWLPSQQCYREISSCSNCEDFQARRMNLRVAVPGGRPAFVHTLNGSGLAVGRTLVAVLENFQRADGLVEVPEVLRAYLGGQRVLDPRGC